MKKSLLPFLVLSFTALCLLSSNMARADEPIVVESTDFTANEWTNGLHLTAGLGINAAFFKSDLVPQEFGGGFNIHTDVGYYFYNAFAVEASVNVVLNSLSSVLIWDTLSTLGVRVRLPYSLGPNHSAPYLRVMAGRGPSVFIYDGSQPAELKVGGERTQIEGDIYGLAYGLFQNARDGTTWFIESSATMHLYRKIEAINDVEGVPEVLYSRSVKGHSAMYALSLTFGVVVF